MGRRLKSRLFSVETSVTQLARVHLYIKVRPKLVHTSKTWLTDSMSLVSRNVVLLIFCGYILPQPGTGTVYSSRLPRLSCILHPYFLYTDPSCLFICIVDLRLLLLVVYWQFASACILSLSRNHRCLRLPTSDSSLSVSWELILYKFRATGL